jgi:hypothetical protein
VDGVSYLLQEIYGIENKYNTQDSKVRFVQNSAFALSWRLWPGLRAGSPVL